jgi:hypothetical protein
MTVASVHARGYNDGLCQVTNGLPLTRDDGKHLPYAQGDCGGGLQGSWRS